MRQLFISLLLLLVSSSSFAAMPSSSVNLTIETTATELAGLINRSLPQEIYKGGGGSGAPSVKVVRNGSAQLSAADDFIYITLPVQLTTGFALYESYPLKLSLKFKLKVSITPDWQLKSELYYVGLSEGLIENIRLGPISINPKGIVEGITLPVQRLLAPLINSKINNTLQLQQKVNGIWQQAFEPLLLNREFNSWLSLAPEKIVVSPLLARDNRLKLSAGIIASARVVVGARPTATAKRPLPQVTQAVSFDKHFHIALDSSIFFEELTKSLQPVLLDKSFGDEKKITIRRFELKGENDRLLVNMSSTGDFDGDLTVIARPVVNRETNSLTFEDVDFDTKNTGWLLSVGSWLFSSKIRSVIKEKLDSSVAEQLEMAKLKASTAISALKIGENAVLAGNVSRLTIDQAAVLPGRLDLLVVAEGECWILLR